MYICRLNKNYCCQCWDVLYRSPHTRKDNVTKIDHNVNPWYQNNTRFIDGFSLIALISLEVSLQLLYLVSTSTFTIVIFYFIACIYVSSRKWICRLSTKRLLSRIYCRWFVQRIFNFLEYIVPCITKARKIFWLMYIFDPACLMIIDDHISVHYF